MPMRDATIVSEMLDIAYSGGSGRPDIEAHRNHDDHDDHHYDSNDILTASLRFFFIFTPSFIDDDVFDLSGKNLAVLDVS